jgi:tRNA(His) guanylyltransferase
MANSRFQYVRSFERAENDRRLLPGCYAVVRLDGRGFTRFSRAHGLRKPNDPRALRLMDAAAAEVMRAFPEVALAYGESDEYSFLLRRAGVPFERRSTKLATLFASTFAAAYVRFWPEFFCAGGGNGDPFAPRPPRKQQRQQQQDEGKRRAGGDGGEDEDDDNPTAIAIPLVSKEPEAFPDEERDSEEGRRAVQAAAAARGGGEGEAAAAPFATTPEPTPLRATPSFDARCVEYPTARTVRDYFSWRQADCHINNQYNTAFWALVQRGGLSPPEAQRALKGTGTAEKNELMFRHGINYNDLPQRYRKGSVICWEEEEDEEGDQPGDGDEKAAAGRPGPSSGSRRRVLALRHCDVIRDAFWEARPEILDEDGDAGDGSGRGAGGRRR